MKSISLHGFKTYFLALICGLTMSAFQVRGGEFVIINQTYTYSANANGFSLHASPPYPGNVPTNWLSPDNYWNGTFYAYYEVIDIPTNQPFALQMGIFQFYPNAANWDGHSYRETCSLTIPTLQGEGDYEYVNYGSPSGWWQHPTGAVDFTRVYDYESVGPVFYSRTPGAYGILYTVDEAAWAVRSNYFPCTLRVIIVAVSSGSSFSGWSNYLGGCTPVKQATPTYSVDLTNHTTNKVVPSTDEYSYSSNMSGAVSGTGVKLALTAGQDVYFRTKASGECLLASDIQYLDVPSSWDECTPVKQATPTYAIDYANHTTDKVVPSTDEYSYSSDMSGAVSGTGSKLALTANQDVYFRTKASGTCYLASDIQYLDVPTSFDECTPVQQATPTYSIDYYNRLTNKVVPSTDEYSYSSDMSGAVSGTGSKIYLNPGNTIYFRTKASGACYLASDIQSLVLPAWPAPPAYTINYSTEKTNQNVPATVAYTASLDYSSVLNGTGVPVILTPGQDLWFWVKATSSSFYSQSFFLDVPSRPAAPSITLNYVTEKTNEVITSGMEYSTSASFAVATPGTGTQITLTPGQDLYIRTKATLSSFVSNVTHLTVPARPSAPAISIDYINEVTSAIPSTMAYSINSSGLSPVTGTNEPVAVTPGTDLYIWVQATGSSFASAMQTLDVPNRPAAPSAITIDFLSEKTNEVITSGMEYSTSSSFTGSSTGTGTKIALTPGQDLYIRTKATTGSFTSSAFLLDVPARPAAPVVTINYGQEKTAESVPITIEYSLNAEMTNPVSGLNTVLALTPGSDLYLRIKSTASAFASTIQHLTVPPRPATPSFTIDFVNEATLESVGSTIEYSENAVFSPATTGTGSVKPLTPETNLYFRVKSTSSSFRSESFMLEVPQRPSIEYTGESTITEPLFTVKAILDESMTGFDLADVSVTNGQAQNLRAENLFDIVSAAEGNVAVSILPNAFDNGGFASNEVVVFYDDLTGLNSTKLNDLMVYPVPSNNGLVYIAINRPGKTRIELLSPTGIMIREFIVNDGGTETLDLEDIKGLYYLKISSGDTQQIRKIVLQ